jgi:hypothetical protein
MDMNTKYTSILSALLVLFSFLTYSLSTTSRRSLTLIKPVDNSNHSFLLLSASIPSLPTFSHNLHYYQLRKIISFSFEIVEIMKTSVLAPALFLAASAAATNSV